MFSRSIRFRSVSFDYVVSTSEKQRFQPSAQVRFRSFPLFRVCITGATRGATLSSSRFYEIFHILPANKPFSDASIVVNKPAPTQTANGPRPNAQEVGCFFYRHWTAPVLFQALHVPTIKPVGAPLVNSLGYKHEPSSC